LPDRLSFGRVSPDNVQVAVVKRAEDGPGLVLRLVETAGLEVKGRARVQFFKPITGIVKTNILEENEADAAGQEGNVPVPIRPFGIETFRVVF
jgi:alpha-mannosidase